MSNMIEPRHMRTSHVTCAYSMSYVICEYVMAHVNEARHTRTRHVTCECFMSLSYVICVCAHSATLALSLSAVTRWRVS